MKKRGTRKRKRDEWNGGDDGDGVIMMNRRANRAREEEEIDH